MTFWELFKPLIITMCVCVYTHYPRNKGPLFSCSFKQTSEPPITWQYGMHPCTETSQDNLLKFHSSITIGEGGFTWLWTWYGWWCQTGSSKYFRNCWLAWIFPVNISKVYREYFRKYEVIVDARGHYWVAAQITTFLQVRHAEDINMFNLETMGYSSRRPHHSC